MDRLSNLVKSQQFSRALLEDLFKVADSIRSQPSKYSNSLQGKVMCALFYEPSTRTRMSFESAMLKLGGKVIGTENAGEFSSAAKGESLEDTVRVVSSYCDIIVLRHKDEHSSERVAPLISIPLINAGDGSGQHPTQALLDFYTIWKEFGRVDGLKIALVGDLAHGRTVRSLAYLCTKFNNINLTLVSPPHLRIGVDIKSHLREHNLEYKEETDLINILSLTDVIYITRIQKERMKASDYDLARGSYIINEDSLKLVREDSRILHPLPHVEEIDLLLSTEAVDKRVAYFRQAENGLYARMALLHHLLNN